MYFEEVILRKKTQGF